MLVFGELTRPQTPRCGSELERAGDVRALPAGATGRSALRVASCNEGAAIAARPNPGEDETREAAVDVNPESNDSGRPSASGVADWHPEAHRP
jgi:hypothetical protein